MKSRLPGLGPLISAIVVPTRAESEEVLERLNAGEDFATLAATHSRGPDKDAGGEVGCFRLGEPTGRKGTGELAFRNGKWQPEPSVIEDLKEWLGRGEIENELEFADSPGFW